jgi:class 3 adenylate cyclase
MTDTDRQLKAILFSDVKSFSAMMSQNEERTMRLIKEHREIVRSILGRHGGEEHGTAGDSFFVLFSSAVKAVQCAVEIQEAFHKRNADQPPEEQLWIRIGIHLGDIIVDRSDGHVYGEGINIAARTEPQAEPGGICITQDVFKQVQRKIDLKVISIGRQEMKNIVDAPELFRIIVGQLGDAGAQPGPTSGAEGRAVVAPTTRRRKGTVAILAVAMLVLGAGVFLATRGRERPKPPPLTTAKASAKPSRPSAPAPGKPPLPKAVDVAFRGKAFINRFTAPKEYEAIAGTLATLVAERLAKHYPDGVMTYAEAQSIGVLASLPADAPPNPLALAKTTGASTVILGELSHVGKSAWMSLSFFDVEQKRIANRVSERSEDDPEKIMKALEDGLAPILQITVGKEMGEKKELIRALVRSRLGFVKYCYEQQLKKTPKLQGRISIAFKITKGGMFENVHVLEESTLKNAAVSSCVSSTFNNLETGYEFLGDVEVIYPFQFEPG